MLCFFDPRQDVSERPYTLEATPPERMVGEPVPQVLAREWYRETTLQNTTYSENGTYMTWTTAWATPAASQASHADMSKLVHVTLDIKAFCGH